VHFFWDDPRSTEIQITYVTSTDTILPWSVSTVD
jgi:hypothetical protein